MECHNQEIVINKKVNVEKNNYLKHKEILDKNSLINKCLKLKEIECKKLTKALFIILTNILIHILIPCIENL